MGAGKTLTQSISGNLSGAGALTKIGLGTMILNGINPLSGGTSVNNGILQVADAKTGQQVYKARVGDGSQSFSSSPIAAGGRIYVLSEDGDTFVFEAGDAYRELARNRLGEMSLATPAADADSLYLRTQTRLYRIRTAARR